MSSTFYHALIHVCAQLSYRELTVILKLSTPARSVVGAVIAHRANRLLKNWVDPPERFWTLLEDAGGVIAGSFVLRLLDLTPDPWYPGSLDVYLSEAGPGPERLMKYLLRSARYSHWSTETFVFVPRPIHRDYPPQSEELIVAGFHEGERCRDDHTIRIFFVRSDEPLEAVPMTWSTTHINFLTTDLLVSAYPRATLHHRGFVSHLQWRSMDHHARMSLAERGYRIHDFNSCRSDGSLRDPECQYDPHALRSLGDTECLRIPINRQALSPVQSEGPIYPSLEVANSVTWQFGAWN